MIIGSMTRIQGTRYTRYKVYEVYEVYKSSADAAWKAATLCLSTVPVVSYTCTVKLLSGPITFYFTVVKLYLLDL